MASSADMVQRPSSSVRPDGVSSAQNSAPGGWASGVPLGTAHPVVGSTVGASGAALSAAPSAGGANGGGAADGGGGGGGVDRTLAVSGAAESSEDEPPGAHASW